MKISITIAAALMAIAGVAVNAGHTSRRLIMGGKPVKKGTKTFNVGIREFIDGESHCGGVLVASTLVLTTYICTEVKPPKFVSVGTHYLNKTLDGEQIPVVSVHTHEEYNSDTGAFDFVLLKLAKPSKFKPIQLPNVDDSDIQTDMMATTMGWGTTTYPDGNFSKGLLAIKLRVWVFEECYSVFDITDTNLCAGGTKGVDACEGDQGGPLIIEQDSGDILIGLVSWGRDCGKKGFPTVFSRVSSAVPWIESMMATL